MDEKQRAQACLAACFILPIVIWFLSAKILLGIDEVNARYQLPYYFQHTFDFPALWGGLIVGGILAIIACVLITIFGRMTFKGAHYDKHYRGTKLVSQFSLKHMTKENSVQATIGGVPIPTDVETQHFSISGSTGSGKSTAIKEMMIGPIKRRERMFILDPDGEFLSLFWKPGDIILNPFDSRTSGWNFFNEIRDPYDFERFAKSIIQKSKSNDSEEWNRYGRLLFQEVARKVYNTSRNPTIREVFRWTNQTEEKLLEQFVTGTPAQAIFTGNERASSSVRFVLSDKLPPHLKMPNGNFSLRRWVEDDTQGNLFITWKEGQKESLTPLISCWVDTIFASILDLPSDPKRRIWGWIDELESLGQLPTLGDALTKGRKKGLCLVTGFQSYTQVEDVYGEKLAETLLGQHRSILALAVGRLGTGTAEKMSKAIGEHEVLRKKSGSSARFGHAPTMSSSEDVKPERVVTASEMTALPDLEGFLALPGDRPVARIKLKPIKFRRKTPVPGIVETSNTFAGR
ncbi:TPA: type IV secretion system DNA-binding domain-containing protein [Pseudomonas putida]